MLSKLIQFVKVHQADIVLALAIVLITVISFNLGKISAVNSQKTPIKITGGENVGQASGAGGGVWARRQRWMSGMANQITAKKRVMLA